MKTFTLGNTITAEQLLFFDTYGFIHFRSVATDAEVDMIIQEMKKIEDQFRQEKKNSCLGNSDTMGYIR